MDARGSESAQSGMVSEWELPPSVKVNNKQTGRLVLMCRKCVHINQAPTITRDSTKVACKDIPGLYHKRTWKQCDCAFRSAANVVTPSSVDYESTLSNLSVDELIKLAK